MYQKNLKLSGVFSVFLKLNINLNVLYYVNRFLIVLPNNVKSGIFRLEPSRLLKIYIMELYLSHHRMECCIIMYMTAHDTQSFFKPDEFLYLNSCIPSNVYNLAHTLLKRGHSNHLFVPIRSLQYLAIIEMNAFWFVDSMAYATRDGEGGRLIRISWHPLTAISQRKSLSDNMDCRVIFYGNDMQDVQKRLVYEFYQAMQQIDQRQKGAMNMDGKVKIVSLNAG